MTATLPGSSLRLLPVPARLLLAGVGAAYLTVVAAGLAGTPLTARDGLTCAVFILAAVISVEVSLRLAWPRTRADRLGRDFLGVWTLPVLLLLPPVYAAVMVAATIGYIQARAVRRSWVKLAYNVAAIGVARAAGSAVHHLLSRPQPVGPGYGLAQLTSDAGLAAVLAGIVVVAGQQHADRRDRRGDLRDGRNSWVPA